jgi:hypothetical protein
MKKLLQTCGVLVTLALLGGCFQTQLYGPVSGAHITVNDLRDDSVVYGEDSDSNLDGEEDPGYSPVAGSWHAIMSGAQLKSAGPKVSPLTEATNRLTWSQQLVGLEIGVEDGTPAEQLAWELAGLSLDDFFSASHQALSLRTPEDVVAVGLVERALAAPERGRT